MLALLFIASLRPSIAQLQEPLSKSYQGEPLVQVLSDLESELKVQFFYKQEWLDGKTVTRKFAGESFSEVLKEIFYKTGLSYEIINDRLIILINEAARSTVPDYTIEGYVKDANTEKIIENATVYFKELETGVVSDFDGFYSTKIPAGRYTLVIKSIGTIDRVMPLILDRDTTLDVSVFDKTIELEGIIVSGQAIDENVKGVNSGMTTLDIKSIKTLPTFMGELDISRIVSTLPGVTSVGEGATGFNVRGGNIDQNLILLDDIPIYNSSHLLGFFSIFNPEMVGNFTLYKGTVPATHGGRSSSLLTVEQQVSNKRDFQIEGGVGPVVNKVKVDVPIVKDKTGLLLAARTANPTWILRQFKNNSLSNSSADYYDVNFKIHHNASEKDVLSSSGYFSNDNFSFGGDSLYSYQSRGLSVRWNHFFNFKLSTSLTGFYSQYIAELEDVDDEFGFRFSNGIRNIGLNANASYFLNDNMVVDIGFNTNLYKFDLGERDPSGQSALAPIIIPEEQGLESAVYMHSEITLSEKLSVNAGLRYSMFTNIGPIDEYVYNPNAARNPSSIIDTVSRGDGEFIRTFSGFEPRFSFNYLLSPQTSLKGGYSINRQYIYLFSNSTASLPTDIWKPVDNNIEPQVSHQYNLGIFRNFKDNKFEASAEVFYKDITSITEVQTGTEILLNETLAADLLDARGRSYGLEMLLKKKIGKSTGWVSYTYSRSERQVVSRFVEEQVNEGDYFFADFDRPHNLNFIWSLKPSRLWSISTNYVFTSGRPVTVPEAGFVYDGVRIFSYTERNNFRIPDTHRLDLSFTLSGSYKRDRKWENSFTLSFYNVLGIRNPYSVYVSAVDNTKPRAFKLTVLGAVFPSFTYNFKFNAKK